MNSCLCARSGDLPFALRQRGGGQFGRGAFSGGVWEGCFWWAGEEGFW